MDDESAMEGMKSNGRDAYGPRFIGFVTINVSGYDTSLPDDKIKSLMNKHFASCGEIMQVYFPSWVLDKCVFVDIAGADAEEKALQLNGSNVGGRSILVEVIPPHKIDFKFTPGIAGRITTQNEILRQLPRPPDLVVVTGFDTRLPDDEIKSALGKHFSSCGEITLIGIGRSGSFNNEALVYIRGEGAVDKALKLNGSDMGGWKLNVVYCSPPFEQTFHRLASPSPRPRKKKAKK